MKRFIVAPLFVAWFLVSCAGLTSAFSDSPENLALHVAAIEDALASREGITWLLPSLGIPGLGGEKEGSGEGALVVASQSPQYQPPDYFPLDVPGTVWRFSKNGGSEYKTKLLPQATEIGGVPASPIMNLKTNIKTYYTSDLYNGIRMHGQYYPDVYVSGMGLVNYALTYDPPVRIAGSAQDVGSTLATSGKVTYEIIPTGISITLKYGASYTLTAAEQVTVPAGSYDALRYEGTFALGKNVSTETFYLVQDVGMVKKVSVNENSVTTTSEMVFTNIGTHDIAVTKIVPPDIVTLTSSKPTKKALVKVNIQNRGPYREVILSEAVLSRLITLTVESLGACAAPQPTLHYGSPQKDFPIWMKSKEVVPFYFDVTFGCANDPGKSTRNSPNHSDYRFSALVDRSAIGDGFPDDHAFDNICPRTVVPPYIVDPYPDQTIQDRGCGAKKTDGTFGGDILTDIVVKP
jgi:hypothetical protein